MTWKFYNQSNTISLNPSFISLKGFLECLLVEEPIQGDVCVREIWLEPNRPFCFCFIKGHQRKTQPQNWVSRSWGQKMRRQYDPSFKGNNPKRGWSATTITRTLKGLWERRKALPDPVLLQLVAGLAPCRVVRLIVVWIRSLRFSCSSLCGSPFRRCL